MQPVWPWNGEGVPLQSQPNATPQLPPAQDLDPEHHSVPQPYTSQEMVIWDFQRVSCPCSCLPPECWDYRHQTFFFLSFKLCACAHTHTYLYVNQHVGACGHTYLYVNQTCGCLWRPESGVGSPGTGVIGVRVPSNVGARSPGRGPL